MITLKLAREKVADLIEEGIPKPTTLRDWTNKGFISGVAKGTGSGSLYRDTLILEIAITVKLKKDYKLKEIAAARKELNITDKSEAEIAEIILLKSFDHQKELEEMKNKAQKKLDGASTIGEFRQFIKELNEKGKEKEKNIEILNNYVEYYINFMNK